MRNVTILTAALAVVFSTGAPVEGATWTVPGTVNTGGLNNTRFVSDLAVTNPGTQPVIASLALVPANGAPPAQILLNPGQTVVTRNVLQQLWGASGAAATVVTASAPLLVRARTYNASQSGTFGVALPVFADDRLLAAGDAGDSLWVAQSADGSTGYRTNVAVVFPDAGGGDATVTVYDANGNAVGSQVFSLSDAGFQQFAVGAFAGAVAVGRAQVVVTRGRAAAYAVVVDNVTGDSSLFTFEDLPAGRQDVLVNGVARANGRNSTFFRTDARVYNPGTADATVTVAFHANQSANPNPASAAFDIPAGQIRDVVDVLDSFLSLPVGSAGALRFTSDAPVAILCRTSNVDPTGVRSGTFGAQQKPVPLLSFLTSADAGAVITGIRQGADFRTNIGFAAGADGASWTLNLKSAEGATVGTASGSLGPWGWVQPNVQDLFSVTVPADATLLMNVTAGSVDVFDSSIDNSSGDPVVTPIMPLPAAIPSSATIGPAGGSLRSGDGRLTLLFPAGAVAAPTLLSIGSESSDAPQGIGSGYVLSPSTMTFAGPLIARASYTSDDVAGSGAAGLALAFHGGGAWYSVGGGLVDTERRTISVVLPAGTLAAASGGRMAAVGLPTPWGPHLAILNAWEIAPKKVSLLTDGQTHFSAFYAGPPSSIPCLSPFCAAGLQSPYAVSVDWYANGISGGDSARGLLSPVTGTTTAYTAPCGRTGVVRVGFVITDARALSPSLHATPPGGQATVKIFPRSWALRIEEKHTAVCPAGLEFWWTSFVKYQFLISEGGGGVSGLHKVDGNGLLNFNENCLKPAGCSSTPDEDFPLTTLQSVAANLDIGTETLLFQGDWTGMAALVGWTVTCPQGTSHVDMIPGRPLSFGPVPLGFGVLHGDKLIGDDRNYIHYTLDVASDPTCP